MALSLVVSVLGPVGGPAAGAQDQTSWYVNDSPSLFGPSQYWWAGDAGKGYGSNNYVYTYGIAGESSADNWARWSMGSRVGRQEIQVYVPNTRATATVLYRIDIGGSQYSKRVAQRNAYGWTALGAYDVDGASVTITLRDNDASQHWNRDGYGSSSIGVDAMAMRCVSRCSTTQPTPAPTATPAPQIEEPSAPRGVGASADADSVSVTWSPPADDGGAAVTGYRVDLYRGSSRVDRKNVSGSARSASFSGLAADTAYQVRVSARNSVGYSDRATANARTSRAVRVPSAPGVVGAVVDVGSIGVAWSPPSDDGGAAVTGYRVDLYRGSTRVDTKSVSGSAREVTFGGLAADTAYEFRISARNSAGTGAEAVGNTRTIPLQKNKPSAPRGVGASAGADSVSVSWSAPSDDGGAAVTGYRVDLYRGSSRVDRKNVSGSARSASFTGLAADTAYQVRVSAQNSVGRSPEATANARTEPDRAEAQGQESEPIIPSEPRSVRVSAGTDSVSVSWAPPADDGGAPVTGYQIELHRGSTPADSKSTAASTRQTTFTNLDPDTAYTVLVSVENSQGLSSSSAADFQTEAARDTRTVTIALGAYRSGSDCDQRANPCRWVSATYSGFDGGPYSASCYSSTSSTSLEKLEASFTARTAAGSDSTLCWFNVQPGRYLTVVVDGVQSNTIQFGGTVQTSRVVRPTAPRNLNAVYEQDGSIRVTWDAPSNSSSSSIKHYRIVASRPAVGSRAAWSGRATVPGTSYTKSSNASGTTYTINVWAINSANQAGEMSQTIVRTVRKEPPSQPKLNLSLSQDGRHCNIKWSPGTGGGVVTSFEVEVNRPLPAPSESRTESFESDMLSTRDCGLVGTDYIVTVRAKNEHGTSTDTTRTITIPGPRLTIGYHGSDWWWLDPDAKISWEPVWGESAEYQLDWRYIDKDNKVVDDKIDKDSEPSDDNNPEIVYTWDRVKVDVSWGRDHYYTGWRYKDLREKNPKYVRCSKGFSNPCSPEPKDRIEVKIKEVERDYILQVRVGDSSGTKWTPWYYDADAFLNVKCKSYSIYNKIKGILESIDNVLLAVTVVGIAAALFTGGTSAIASVGVKEAAKQYAKKLVAKMLTKKLISEFFESLLKEILKNAAGKIADLAIIVACVVQAQNGNESFEIDAASEIIREIVNGSKVGDEAFKDSVIENTLKQLRNI